MILIKKMRDGDILDGKQETSTPQRSKLVSKTNTQKKKEKTYTNMEDAAFLTRMKQGLIDAGVFKKEDVDNVPANYRDATAYADSLAKVRSDEYIKLDTIDRVLPWADPERAKSAFKRQVKEFNNNIIGTGAAENKKAPLFGWRSLLSIPSNISTTYETPEDAAKGKYSKKIKKVYHPETDTYEDIDITNEP